MALVKASKVGGGARKNPIGSSDPVQAVAPTPRQSNRSERAAGRHTKASERVSAATEQLAAGLTEAAAAAEQLRRSMEQIASGAEEAAGASQEQLTAVKNIVANLSATRGQSETARRRTEAAQVILAETAGQITSSMRAIARNADRQQAVMVRISELEHSAENIGEVTRAVGEISDQINLLALNAAIEAARAGEHGRGFAVVAEEVRELAEISEKGAQDGQSLAATIQSQVREVVKAVRAATEGAVTEAQAGAAVVDGLEVMREDMARIVEGGQETVLAAVEVERAAVEVQRSAEQIAGAAEEQSAAAAEAQSALQQQVQSLDQSQAAARALAALSEELQAGRGAGSVAEQIGASAEQLSATVQELSGAASQILASVEQINRGAEQQASATQEISAALSQIENGARTAQRNAETTKERVKAMQAAVGASRAALGAVVDGVEKALAQTQSSVELMRGLGGVGGRLEKMLEAIALVAVQTSMLAVSGAVEAARAGDAGRGFAIVSHDIRRLARETSESIDRVRDTVRGLVTQILSMQRELEQTTALSQGEAERNRAITEAFGKVDGEVQGLAAANSVIVEAAGAMLAATAEAVAGASQIAAAAEEASAAAREAATASAEQARGAEDLAAAIEEIASLSDELNQPDA